VKNYLIIILSIFISTCNKDRKKEHSNKQDVYFLKAESLYNKNSDSAFYYFYQFTTLNRDSLLTGQAFSYMAFIQSNAGDNYGAQESLIHSLKYLNKNIKDHWLSIATNYNELGLTSMNLKEYKTALGYFNKALPFYTNLNYLCRALNNKAWAYRELGQYNKAIKIYKYILNQKVDTTEYARFLSNSEKTKWLQNPKYNASFNLLKALSIRKMQNDNWGLNASYSHLTDYYTRKNADSALIFALKMYQTSLQIKSSDDQIEALQKLITLSPEADVKKYFNTYQKLSDSLQTARSAAKNQFALIRFETERHIADNLILQKDVSAKRYQLIIIISVSIFIFGYGILWYKKRRQRLALEAEQAIRENKLKTSQKVHDVVANGLYRIMSKLDNQETLKHNPIVNEIEELYEQSRDLSYEKPQSKNQDFHNHIFELLKSFASENTRVILVGNSAPLWEKVSEQAKDEIAHILQELMVNMAKHSQASDVVIKFEQVQQKINIYYTDNGIGIAGKPQAKNGLTNTGSRIDAIGGTITFDTKVEKGLKIQISFPVS